MSDSAPTDALAAEYVLGTLDFDERTQAQALLEIDQEFVAKVRLWERRLGELHLMVEPVEPDGRIWERIKAKMPPPPPKPEPKPEPKPPEPAVEPATVAEPPADAPAAETTPATAPEQTPATTPGDEPTPITTLPPAPSIPSPAGDLTPSLAPGLQPSSVASPAASLPLIPPMRPLPDSVPGFLTGPPPGQVAGPASAAAAVLSPSVQQRALAPIELDDDSAPVIGRRLGLWRVLAVLMTLVVVAFGGLVAAWRFAPEHVPPKLHPAELMSAIGVTMNAGPRARKPAPPESQFDE